MGVRSVYTPHGGGANGNRGVFADQAGANTVSRVEHYGCGAAGLAVTAVAVFLLYPVLVALARPLYLLSSTALTLAFVVAWLTTWALFECVCVWRAAD